MAAIDLLTHDYWPFLNGTPYQAGHLKDLDRKRNIAIAHSQGGIVGRAIRYVTENDSRYQEVYGALATFGTPHRGAFIVNCSESSGPAQAWLTDGCRAISAVELQTFIGSIWWLDLFITPSEIQSITSEACNGLSKTLLPKLVNSIRKPLADNYKIGAPQLAKLDSFARIDSAGSDLYGIEEEPALGVSWSNDQTTDNLSGYILDSNPFTQ